MKKDFFLTLSSPPALADDLRDSWLLLLLLRPLLPSSRPDWPCEGFGFEPRRFASRKMLENTGDSDPIELALFIHFGECATNSLDGTVSGERDTSLPPTERLRLLFPASDGGRGDVVGVGEGV